MPKPDKYQTVSELAKRRGFFWPSYEIYGGARGFLTYGFLGTLLKRRIEAKFRSFFVKPLNIVEMESAVVTPAKVFEASGHVEAFQEQMVECMKCGKKLRADHLLQEQAKMSDTQTEKLSLQETALEFKKRDVTCPECGGKLGKPNYFLTMFTTTIGPYSNAVGYGRPEAAQGIFAEFHRIHEISRGKLPLGVVQIGHALRNEISPRQGPIRLREFTIADIEFFFDPEEPHCTQLKEVENVVLPLIPAVEKAKGEKKTLQVTAKEAIERDYIKKEWQAYFMILAKNLLNELGVPDGKQRFVEKLEWERAHYSSQGYDQEINLDRWGWTEVSGHNYRTDYDLKQHMKHSGVDMRVFKERAKPAHSTSKTVARPILGTIGPTFKRDSPEVLDLLSKADVEELKTSLEKTGYYMLASFKVLPEHVKIVHKDVKEKGRRFLPHVIEPSFGIDRLVYIALEFAYSRLKSRTTLKLPIDIAPIQLAVYPLIAKKNLTAKSRKLYTTLVKEGFEAEYDEAGSIGRRYARADEAGTPLCITVDYQTLDNNTVTIRDRDTREQVRANVDYLPSRLTAYFRGTENFEGLGEDQKTEKQV